MPSHSVEEQIAAPFVRHKGRGGGGGGGADKAGVNDSLSLFSLTRPTFIGQGASARRSGSRLWERKWTEVGRASNQQTVATVIRAGWACTSHRKSPLMSKTEQSCLILLQRY